MMDAESMTPEELAALKQRAYEMITQAQQGGIIPPDIVRWVNDPGYALREQDEDD